MESRVSSAKKDVLISDNLPTVLIGEGINPNGNAKLTETLKRGEMSLVRELAISQVEAGADILDVNASVDGLDEVELLPKVLEEVLNVTDVPVSIDTNNPAALATALELCPGKPIINSVTGEAKSLNYILPLVKESGAAVFALLVDDNGIPKDPEGRLAIARNIISKTDAMGIPKEDVIIDCLALTVGAENTAALTTLETIRRVKYELTVNQTLGASNVSYGLPEREVINNSFLALAIEGGVTCPILDIKKQRLSVMGIDLVLGRDQFAQRFIQYYNKKLTSGT